MSGDEDLKFDKESLALITKGLKSAVGELKEAGADSTGSLQGSGFDQMPMSKMEAGNGRVADIFEDFCERWEWGVRALVQDANALAERLHLAAGMTFSEDEYWAGTWKVGANSVVGNPHASEEDVAQMSYSEIMEQNRPDYSGDSFEKAWNDSKQTWQDTGRSVATEGLGGFQNDVLNDAAGVPQEQRDAALDKLFGPSPEERAQRESGGGEG